MAEFVQTMKDWRRMCKAYTTDDESCCDGCPLRYIEEHGCGAIFEDDFADVVDWHELERRVVSWAAEHPEPVYPTWREYLMDLILPNSHSGNFATFLLEQYIPADIAQKLGLQPKEGEM